MMKNAKNVKVYPLAHERERKEVELEKAPKDWKTAIALEGLWGSGKDTIRRAAEKYRAEHPDWFRVYRSRIQGSVAEYYHLDLISQLEKDLKVQERKAKEAPMGWKTPSALQRWGSTFEVIKAAAEKYRAEHPDWFHDYWSNTLVGLTEHYHPDLISQLEKDLKIQERKANKTPEGWRTSSSLSKAWGNSRKVIERAAEKYRAEHPDWFHDYWSDKLDSLTEYYASSLINKLEADLGVIGHKEKKASVEKAPTGWRTLSALAGSFSINVSLVKSAAEKYRAEHPDWFHDYWLKELGDAAEYYHPDLISQLEKDLKIQEHKEKKSTVEKAPAGWKTSSILGRSWEMGNDTIQNAAEKYRAEHPRWFCIYRSRTPGGIAEYYHPDLISQLEKDLKVQERKEKKANAEKAPEGWRTPTNLGSHWSFSGQVIERAAEKYRAEHPDWFHDYWSNTLVALTEYYHPDLISQLEKDLKVHERAERKASAEKAPEGWRTPSILHRQWGNSTAFIKKVAEKYRAEHPEWFHDYWAEKLVDVLEHYHPDLVLLLERELKSSVEDSLLKEGLTAFLKEASENATVLAKDFRKLLFAFGSSRCVDVLFQFRPEYRALKHDYVRGLISEYLGDCLTIKCGVPPDRKGLLLVIEQLSNPDLQEGLYETMKDDCYHFCINRQRADASRDRLSVVAEYEEHLRSRSGDIDNPAFTGIIHRVVKYYTDLWKGYEKPDCFVDKLKPGREFPDINQRINIKELEDKKRIVIADEMGVGKSASVIMAKEHLGVKCALVIVPSNVVATWRKYLSDNPEGGYFKPGQAPSVLVVEDPDQLQGIETADYDYVIVSQERLNDRYTQDLLKVPYDMLIVDEFHKLKSLKGVRSGQLLQLAQKIEEKEEDAPGKKREKYLALLSGTPVPNKVQDIAISLKLLYPERFGTTEDSQLVLQILKGDILNLRSLLLPHLQMKSLRDAVEMPPLTEELIEIEAGELEQEIYQVFIEDDELTFTEKLILLRQFTLSPWTVESTPAFTGAKIERVGEDVRAAFETKKRVLLFVDDFVENVIRGERTIMQEFNLPADVAVRVVHGGVSPNDRNDIQKEFQDRNSPQKIFLVVSGQTADVGVDYSGAEGVFHYNEPWTKYRKNQELGRANRPGLAQPLLARTYITKRTIEQGMHEYIERKYQAVEKLVRGVPLNHLEMQLLEEDEKQDDDNLEVNSDLAAYYFSNWDRMMQFFGHAKELGEESFRSFVETHGKEYAEGYAELGVRSYQANANRVSGTVIHQFVRGDRQKPESIKILDVASGPEMLKRHIDERYQERVTSIDINPHHFPNGTSDTRVVGGWMELPCLPRSFDYVNLSLALDQAEFVPSKGKTERIEVLKELNRVLKTGGKAILSMIYSVDFKDESGFRSAIAKFGFRTVNDFCGEVTSGTHYSSRLVVLEKMDDIEIETEEKVTGQDLLELLTTEEREGMKLVEKKARIRDTRKVLTSFEINGRKERILLNAQDKLVLGEEEDIVMQGENLKKLFDRIGAIPPRLVTENGFVRVKVGNKYVLFKKLTRAPGVVVIK